MKIILDTEIKNLDGTSIPQEKGKVTTLKYVFCNILSGQIQEKVISGEEKVRRYNLATEIYRNTEIELGVSDIKLLMDLVAEGYVPLISGQIWNILDPPQCETPGKAPEDGDTIKGVPMKDGTV